MPIIKNRKINKHFNHIYLYGYPGDRLGVTIIQSPQTHTTPMLAGIYMLLKYPVDGESQITSSNGGSITNINFRWREKIESRNAPL